MKKVLISILFLLAQYAIAQSDCSTAVVANLGTNSLPATLDSEYWYTYTMPSESKLQITSTSSENLTLYTNNCGSLNLEVSNLENASLTTLTTGDIVYIQWSTVAGGNFDWDLEVVPFEAGDKCSFAQVAVLNTNSLPSTTSLEYWYTYTMPSTGKLQIASTSSANLTVYTNTCNDLSSVGTGFENVTVTTLTSGDIVYIQWLTEGIGNFEWDLFVSPLEVGDNCDLAETAVLGNNSVPSTLNSEYWYTFTMPSEGELHITSTSSFSVNVYTNTCSDLIFEESGFQNVSITPVAENEIVYIKWFTKSEGNFSWELAVAPFLGSSCSLAETAILGTNSVPSTVNPEYWYTYTMPSTSKLQITSSEEVTVFKNTCDSPVLLGTGFENLTIATLTIGEVVYIQWSTESGGNFDWDLSVVPLEEGDNCNLAETAILGTNSLPNTLNSEYWYTYIMPSTSELLITSTSSENVSVYTNTCNALSLVTSGFQSITTAMLTMDEVIYIKWSSGGGGDFGWSISQGCPLLDQIITFDVLVPKTFGDSDFDLTASASSGLEVSYSVISGPVIISGKTVSITGAGDAIIEATQAGDDASYNPAVAIQQILTINKADQTINFDMIAPKVFGDGDFGLTATASSGLEVDYLVMSGPAIVSGRTVSITGAGDVMIEATQAGNANYNPAITIQQTLTINKADQTITLNPIDDKLITDAVFDVVVSSNSGLIVDLSISGPASINGSVITLDGTVGIITVTASQSGDTNYNEASDVSVSFNVIDPCADFSAVISGSSDNLCTGESLGSIDITVSGGTGNYSYNWSNGSDSEDLFGLSSGIYTLTVTDGNSCSTTLEAIIEEPEAIAIASVDTEAGASDIRVAGGTGSYSFLWSNGATTRDLTNVAGGDYTITVTDENGCSQSATVTVNDIILGVNNDAFTTNFKYYPNPVTNNLTVDVAFERTTEVVLQVLDLSGRSVMRKQYLSTRSLNTVLDLSFLGSGQYLLLIKSEDNQRATRITVAR